MGMKIDISGRVERLMKAYNAGNYEGSWGPIVRSVYAQASLNVMNTDPTQIKGIRNNVNSLEKQKNEAKPKGILETIAHKAGYLIGIAIG